MENADVQTAVVAREALEGHSIYDGGFCKLHLSYSRHTDLSIKVVNVDFFLLHWAVNTSHLEDYPQKKE